MSRLETLPARSTNDAPGALISDEELCALALAAEMDPTIDDDALPWSMAPMAAAAFLPSWYMPPALATRCRGWKAGLVVAVIVAFLIIDAFGLCSTYG